MSLGSSPSANFSGEKSQRSHNYSASSNPSNSYSNKRTKSNQKTLGVAWGANSPSSSRSSNRKSPFSDFGSYMVEKNKKLHNQFNAEASNSSHNGASPGKPIFDGICIFVDGFTIPSSQELRKYMLKYGGNFKNYFSRHQVTHIICSNLPDSKIKNIRSFSCGLPVVKPTWILDSVAANKLLSWVPYVLDQLANDQPRLSAFFSAKSIPMLGNSSTCRNIQEINETEVSSFKIATENDEHICQGGESKERRDKIPEELNITFQENITVTAVEEPLCNFDSEVVRGGDESSHCRPSLFDSSHNFLDPCGGKSPNGTTVERLKSHHSILEDPNFVENYFKVLKLKNFLTDMFGSIGVPIVNSRLHFIGTWRNRYRKRFPNLTSRKSTSVNNFGKFGKTVIIHVDMDCFFVSVVIRKNPVLVDKPVAICHSDNPKGTAEISSANYPARVYGVKAGMFVRHAKALCPQLAILPYNFKAYEEVADDFYNILHKHSNIVQAVSCDEAFLDVSDLVDPELLASTIRKEIFETTGCTASAGIAGNMLVARLATKEAKPNGQCLIPPEKVDHYLDRLPINALPGIGRVLEEKLKGKNISTCGQLRMISKDFLQKDFGTKTGEMLWNYSRGVDNRLVGVIQESRSMGAEVNWGVRFKDLKDTQYFLFNLCKEVSLRLQDCGMRGRTFTLKIKKRRENAEEPIKYMGCGDCENLSHSMTIPLATDDLEVLQRITKQLFGFFNIDVKEVRGIGLQVSKLENTDISNHGMEKNSLKSWLTSSSTPKEQCNYDCMPKEMIVLGQHADQTGLPIQMDNYSSSSEACLNQVLAPPSLCHLDMGVIESLPPDLFAELNEVYAGKLVNLIGENKTKGENLTSCLGSAFLSQELAEGSNLLCLLIVSAALFESDPLPANTYTGLTKEGEILSGGNDMPLEKKFKMMHQMVEEAKSVPVSATESSIAAASRSVTTDLFLSSLSQVDTEVLLELPEELRYSIVDLLPLNTRTELSSNDVSNSFMESPHKTFDAHTSAYPPETMYLDNLWSGIPPLWVDEFKASNYWTLKILAQIYDKLGFCCYFSQILQKASFEVRQLLDVNYDNCDETVTILCELFKQYIKRKIETDIEEIHMCFCILERLMLTSKLFGEVYKVLDPFLQASVREKYGGILHISSSSIAFSRVAIQ